MVFVFFLFNHYFLKKNKILNSGLIGCFVVFCVCWMIGCNYKNKKIYLLRKKTA